MTTPQAFTITCVTCGSRLKVSSRSLVGSIESCPKCGAMVQITAPDDEAFGLDSAESYEQVAIGPLDAVDSDAITQSAVAGIGAGVNQGNRISPSSLQAKSSVIPPPPAAKSEDAASPAATRVDDPSDYRREVDGAWQNESTRRTKQLVLIALMSLFGLIAAAAVFSQFVRTWRDQQAVTQAPPASPADSPADSVDETPIATNPETPQPTPEPTIPTESLEPSIAEPPATSIEPTPGVVAQSPSTTTDSGVPPLVTTPFEIPSTEPSGENNPAEKVIADDSASSQMKNLPPGLLKFTPLLSLETADNQTAMPLQPPPTIDTVRIDEAASNVEVDGILSPPRKPIDIEKSLAQRFAIDNRGASLAELLLVVAPLTTVPIEIELISLDAAGFRVEAPINTPSKFMSSRQWIDGICQSLGMVSQTIDDRLMISASDTNIDAGVNAALQLDDFGDDARATFQWMLPLLQDEQPAVGSEGEAENIAAPLPTTLSDEGNAIVPGVTLRSKMRAVLTVEAVRLMRGMPTKLERWRTSRWMGPWPENNAAIDASSFGDWPVVTEGKRGPELDSPRAVADLLRSLGAINQAEVLVGWYDATRHGLYPADPMMPYSNQPTAAAMLDEILGEQGLQTRVCGPSLWYVCSEANYDRFEVIAWYSIPPGSENEIRQRLANSVGQSDASTMPIAFDDNRLLIRCPRYLARQVYRIINP